MESLIGGSVFYQIVAMLVLASGLGFFAVRFRLPLIVAFIGAGILAGPDVFNIVGSENLDFIEALAEFGIAILLFMVGLELDLRIVQSMGRSALLAGLAQIILTTALGFALCLAVGFSPAAAGVVGLALSFSSTIIAVKLLSDGRTADSLYGRLALGILIVQDLVVILAMVGVTILTGGVDGGKGSPNIFAACAGVATLFIFAFLFIRFAADRVTRTLARHGELMTVTCITFAVLMAALGDALHLGRELGGLIAGMMLASTPYNNVISGRLRILRDFLLLFFFAHLGAHVSLARMGDVVWPVVALSVFVLAGKPMIVMAIIKRMGFPRRIGFLSGLSLCQVSEFSLVLAAMASAGSLIDDRGLAIITLTGLVTMGLSSTAILYGKDIYQALEVWRVLPHDDKTAWDDIPGSAKAHRCDVVLLGLGRYGMALAKYLQARGLNVLGVDFDPGVILAAQAAGIPAMYGDAADPEITEHLPLDHAQAVVFSFHHYAGGPTVVDLRRTLAKILREKGYGGHIVTTSHHPESDGDLRAHGIDVVLNPFNDAAESGVIKIAQALESR